MTKGPARGGGIKIDESTEMHFARKLNFDGTRRRGQGAAAAGGRWPLSSAKVSIKMRAPTNHRGVTLNSTDARPR